MAVVAVVDTETTSLTKPWLPGGRRPWEVAVILYNTVTGLEAPAVGYVDVSASDLADADPYALKCGGFYSRAPQVTGRLPMFDGVPVHRFGGPEDAGRWLETLMPPGVVLVGVNAPFDEDNLHWLLWRSDQTRHRVPPWHYTSLDVKAAGSGKAGVRSFPHTSAEVSDALGVSREKFGQEHTGLADARWALAQLKAVYGGPAAGG